MSPTWSSWMPPKACSCPTRRKKRKTRANLTSILQRSQPWACTSRNSCTQGSLTKWAWWVTKIRRLRSSSLSKMSRLKWPNSLERLWISWTNPLHRSVTHFWPCPRAQHKLLISSSRGSAGTRSSLSRVLRVGQLTAKMKSMILSVS